MEIRPGDLIRLRRDIERSRKHEEERRSRAVSAESDKTARLDQQDIARPRLSISLAVRIRGVIDALLGPRAPSRESLETIPEYLIIQIQVIREEPKFRRWLLQLEGMSLTYRNQQLERMSHAFRIEDGGSTIAALLTGCTIPLYSRRFVSFFAKNRPAVVTIVGT